LDDTQATLINFQPRRQFFVGFDSDGCVFDTMEVKQKECFCPNIIKYWGLQPVARYAREAVEFVTLYSKWRGYNRYPALVKVFDLLAERRELRDRGFQVPPVKSLREWINSGEPLGHASLKAKVEASPDPELQRALEWSTAVNRAVEEMAPGIRPFPYVRETMAKLYREADLICISQTPTEIVEREWAEHDLLKYVALIAGPELGGKVEHLGLAAGGKYPNNHILLVGDAIGDLKAAQANQALFYPINPGGEEASWRLFYEEALDRFLNESYEGEYETELIRKFKALLPEIPPWKRQQRFEE